MSSKSTATILLLVSVLIASMLCIFTRNLTKLGFSPFDIVFVRLFFGVLALFVIIMVTSRGSLKIEKKDILLLIFFGVSKFLMDYTFVTSLEVINVSLSVLLQNTAPYFVVIVSYFLLKEKVSKMTMLSIIMGTVGCVLMAGKTLLYTELDPMGIIFALLSSFFLAMFYIGSDRSEKKGYSAATYLFYVLLVAAIVTIPFADMGTIFGNIADLNILFHYLVLGIVMTLMPFYIMAWSVRHLDSVAVSVICVMEVLFAAIVGVFYFDEVLDILDAIGIVMMIASIVLISKISGTNGSEDTGQQQS